MSDRISREHVRQYALASTAGPLKYGMTHAFDPERGETLRSFLEKTPGGSDEIWITWQKRADGDYFTAVTGNGPTSEANALFYSQARQWVLELCDEVDELRERIAEYEGSRDV